MEAGPREVYALGHALRRLREQGVFIVGSGGMTHNLGEFFGGRPELGDPADPYVIAFSRWVEDAVQANDRERLFNYRTLAPHAVRAHPSEEHFLPIFFALGAAGWGDGGTTPSRVNYMSREVMYRYLAMDAFMLQ
jgi:4,5-DOPA dioxygenase extradiol